MNTRNATPKSKHAARLLSECSPGKQEKYVRRQIAELDPAYADLEDVVHTVMLQCASSLHKGASPAECVLSLHAYLSSFVPQCNMLASTGTQLIEATKDFQACWNKITADQS